ncbi:hypothetical protein MKW92_047368 [Papaver armeniacum]|nr:hypothetical protein MKW92_047368 [Papaver armeniacum]
MGNSIIIFPLFLFCLLCLPHFIAGAKNCRKYQCGKGEPVISYPFRIKGHQDERCGHPGFDLTCDNMNRTVLELPFSGRFLVKRINYDGTYNAIQLKDPDECLARRFLDRLNLSDTPFIGVSFKECLFFDCSSYSYFSPTAPMFFHSMRISCLSSSTKRAYATCNPGSSESLWLEKECALIATVPFPVIKSYNSSWYPDIFSETVHLTWRWNKRYCKRNCSKDPDVPYTGSDKFDATKLLISVGIIVPLLFASVMYFCCCRDANSHSQDVSSGVVQTRLQHVITTTGLGGSAIQSLPMVALGESGRLPNPDINTCSICLSEYRPKETLKTLPLCNHCFHADCIDVWLRLKSTCPICRKYPIP